VRYELDLSVLGYEQVTGCCGQDIEALDSVSSWEIF
jgi:hypothetical protein